MCAKQTSPKQQQRADEPSHVFQTNSMCSITVWFSEREREREYLFQPDLLKGCSINQLLLLIIILFEMNEQLFFVIPASIIQLILTFHVAKTQGGNNLSFSICISNQFLSFHSFPPGDCRACIMLNGKALPVILLLLVNPHSKSPQEATEYLC